MLAPSVIRRLSIERLDIPLHTPFGIAGGAQVVASNALVTVELASGARGYGEAAPFPAFNGETQEHALEAVAAARPLVEGKDARGWRPIAQAIRGVTCSSASARYAIETAVLDALARQVGLPLWAFFGGAATTLVTDVTIPTGSIAEARAQARSWAAAGFTRLKIKVGGSGAAEDLPRLEAIHAEAPSAELMLDGNGGLGAAEALDLLASLRARAITPILFEQPVPGDDLPGLAEVARRGGVPVAADESVAAAADVLRIAAAGAAQVVNIKLMKSGVAEALAIAEAARAAGLGLMIGGMVEARLAMGMSACFAAGLGGFSFVDLDTPLFLAHDPFEGGYTQRGEGIDVGHIAGGHGVTPRG